MGISDSGQLCLNSFSADCDKHYGRYEDPLRTHSVAYCICFCMFGMGYKKKTKRKRDVWLETIPSIRLRVFVSVRKEERGRRSSAALSGKMCFSVTMAFSVHNLSHQALWGMCLSLPPTGRGQNQSWLIVGLAFTVSLTYMSSVHQSHQKGQTHTVTLRQKKKKSSDWCLAHHRSV